MTKKQIRILRIVRAIMYALFLGSLILLIVFYIGYDYSKTILFRLSQLFISYSLGTIMSVPVCLYTGWGWNSKSKFVFLKFVYTQGNKDSVKIIPLLVISSMLTLSFGFLLHVPSRLTKQMVYIVIILQFVSLMIWRDYEELIKNKMTS